MKFFEQIKSIKYNHLWFAVSKNWREEGNGVEHSFYSQRLNEQMQAT